MLFVIFLLLTADHETSIVGEAATLPTQYGMANRNDTAISLAYSDYTGTLPSELGFMTLVTTAALGAGSSISPIPTSYQLQ